MPVYEYQCDQCGKIEEAFQRLTESPLSTCKHCSGTLNKIISQSTFHLKGSGWYVTDYANKKSGPTKSASPPKNESTKAEVKTKQNSEKTKPTPV
jgi:putative FmdB family regulatory protein